MRCGHADAVTDLGLAVSAVTYHRGPVQHPAYRQARLPAPRAPVAVQRIRFDRAPGRMRDKVRQLAFQVGAEQSRDPGPAAIVLAYGLKAEALPAFEQLSAGRTDVQVVGECVADPAPLPRMQDNPLGIS
jgi:hypothetical protein